MHKTLTEAEAIAVEMGWVKIVPEKPGIYFEKTTGVPTQIPLPFSPDNYHDRMSLKDRTLDQNKRLWLGPLDKGEAFVANTMLAMNAVREAAKSALQKSKECRFCGTKNGAHEEDCPMWEVTSIMEMAIHYDPYDPSLPWTKRQR